MSFAYTYCEECDNVEANSRKRTPSSWVCLKFPRVEGGGFVAPKVWADMDPFMRCTGINGGRCPMWAPRRESENEQA